MNRKRFWHRLVASLLTLSLVFSLLAMPASAANVDSWIYGGLISNIDGPCYEWGTEETARDEVINEWNTSGQVELQGPLTEEKLDELIAAGKPLLESQGYIVRDMSIPDTAYLGYSKTADSPIYWYTKSDFSSIVLNSMNSFSVDWDTGILTATNGLNEVEVYPIGYGTSEPGITPAPSTGSSSAGGSGDSAGVLLLAGGAAAVGVSALYLYTHPEIVQNVKQRVQDFFRGITEKFQPDAASEAPAQ